MNWKILPCWARVAVAIGLTIFVFNWPKSSAEWASWIQAFGSILAIGVAIFLSQNDKESLKLERMVERRDENKKQLNVALRSALYMMNTLACYQVEKDKVKRPDFSEIEFFSIQTRLDNAIFIAKKTLDSEQLNKEMFFLILCVVDLGFEIRELFIADYKRRNDFSDSQFIIKFSNIEKTYQATNKKIEEIINLIDIENSLA